MSKKTHDPLTEMSAYLAHKDHSRQQHLPRDTERRSHTISQPNQTNQNNDMRSKAERREATERERVEALLQSRSASSSRRRSTSPVPSNHYNDQFFREDVQAAHTRRPASFRHEQDFRVRPTDIDPGGLHRGTGEEGSKKEDVDQTGTDTGKETFDMNCSPTPQIDTVRPEPKPLQSLDANSNTRRITESEDSLNSASSIESTSSTDSKGVPKESMYPVLLGEMIQTVMEHEHYLFTAEEQALLQSYFCLAYESRHLLARLIQRKSTWHRIDNLHYDYDVREKAKAVADLCSSIPQSTEGSTESLSRFCWNEDEMDGNDEEALSLLNLEELKCLAKKMKCLKGTATKANIISALLQTRKQDTLFSYTSSEKTTSFRKGQLDVLREQMRETMGGCIRISPYTKALLDRVALVYYRGASLGSSALTVAILSRSRKRNYPRYNYQRSNDLFSSRQQVLDLQRALELEIQMDQWIEWEGGAEAMQNAHRAMESVYEEWQAAVIGGQKLLSTESHDFSLYNRMRFHPGWPLTRVVYKGVQVLARLHLHEREAEVLRQLLHQRVFRRGRRGDWYDRLALITANYPSSTTPNAIRKAKWEALQIAVQGIEDPDTHLIYHDTLQRRITRLESQLNLPFSEKHDFSYAKLRKCEQSTFFGVRLDSMQGEKKSLFGTPLQAGRHKAVSVDGAAGRYQERAPLRKVVKVERMKEIESHPDADVGASFKTITQTFSVERREVRRDMHSVWRGLDGEPCRVESLVLQQYSEKGFRGFHCEGGILIMLFVLLMWDIIFSPIHGVFETPYQSQPLDLVEDSFSIVRGPMIRQRLMEIENTGGLEFIKTTDQRERGNKTWAVGCKWDTFTREELLEVAECMGGHALAVLCQMLSEEWSYCTSGMPDLCVWRYSDKQVRFCEVKGPGDKLSDKQKLWIDVLLRAGLHVEVSTVKDS